MVDYQPSNNLDDLFGFGVPESRTSADVAPVYSSRREMREAEARASKPRSMPTSSETAVVATSSADLVHSSANRTAPARRTTASSPSVPARKLKRTEARLVRASAPRQSRKNPLSVLVTMAAVGGMFGVAGLPAYALPPVSNASSTTTTVADAQTLLVSSQVSQVPLVRDSYHASTQADVDAMEKNALRAAQNEAYNASGAREMGDDYPWPYELMEGQGGGLSPLNYYYRECVDFVAWRLNRDAGSYSAPFKWVWSNLTPYGGNGGQWMYNWEQHGWPISKTPIKGAVAYTGGNHVAYVKQVNADGTVLIEEYNYIHGMYGQRTLPADSVVAFLYPPPA